MVLIFPFCFHSFPADQQHTEGLVCWRILIWTCVKSQFEVREILKSFTEERNDTCNTDPGTAVPRKEGKIKNNFLLVTYSFFAFLLTAQNPLCCVSTENWNCQNQCNSICMFIITMVIRTSGALVVPGGCRDPTVQHHSSPDCLCTLPKKTESLFTYKLSVI